MATCCCLGPMNGEPLCPCMMRAARGYLVRPRYSEPVQFLQGWFTNQFDAGAVVNPETGEVYDLPDAIG